MKKHIVTKGTIFIPLTCLMLCGVLCDKGTNPPPASQAGPIELLYPKGGNGQSFKVGDTVRIRWSIHDRGQVGSVGIKYSTDGGKLFSGYPIGTGSFSYPDTTYVWTVGSEHVSDQFVLKVYEYNNNVAPDKSGIIIIRQ